MTIAKDISEFPFLTEISDCLSDPTITVLVSNSWGAACLNGRNLLHQFIDQQALKKKYISISHCPTIGGFASSDNGPIGFDLEELSRPTIQTVGRVCSSSEMESAPHPALLWSAKEATFKAFKGPKQPKVISKIEILNWKNIVSFQDTLIFRFDSNPTIISDNCSGQGVAIQTPSHVYAIYCLKN